MNLIRIILVLLVSVGVPCTFSKTRKLQRFALGLITLALLIQTVQFALQHNLEETALTGILAILYYFVYIRTSKTTLRSDLDDIEQDVSFKDWLFIELKCKLTLGTKAKKLLVRYDVHMCRLYLDFWFWESKNKKTSLCVQKLGMRLLRHLRPN